MDQRQDHPRRSHPRKERIVKVGERTALKLIIALLMQLWKSQVFRSRLVWPHEEQRTLMKPTAITSVTAKESRIPTLNVSELACSIFTVCAALGRRADVKCEHIDPSLLPKTRYANDRERQQTAPFARRFYKEVNHPNGTRKAALRALRVGITSKQVDGKGLRLEHCSPVARTRTHLHNRSHFRNSFQSLF